MLQGLVTDNLADTEIGDAQVNGAVRPPLHEDVGRLQVAVDDRRLKTMREADRLRQVVDRPGRPGDGVGERPLLLVPAQGEGREVAAVDVFILQAGRIRGQVGVAQLDDAGMLALGGAPG